MHSPILFCKRRPLNFILAAGIATVLAHGNRLDAATYTWDSVTGLTGAQDGAGTWDTATASWWNGSSDIVWTNSFSDTAVFGAGSGAAGAVTVVSGSVNGIIFNAAGSGNYTLSSGTITLGGTSPTITVNASGTSTIASVLAGTAGLNIAGVGTLALTGSNSYSGATGITGGTLQIGNGTSGSIPSASAVTVGSGGTLALYLAGTGTFANAITTSGGALVNSLASGTTTLSGTITGPGGLNQTGPGTTVLTASNSYSGQTNVTSGVLQLNHPYAASLSTLNVSTSNALAFGTNTVTVGGLSGSGGLSLVATSGTGVTFNFGNNNSDSTFTGNITGTASSVLKKIGNGVLNFTNSASVSAATTWVSSGTMNVNATGVAINATSLQVGGAAASTTLMLQSGTVTTNSLGVGKSGFGAFGVVNMSGGVLNAGPSENDIGYWISGSGTFNLSGGTVNCSGWLNIADAGNGTINQTGGVFNYTNATDAAVGYNANSGTGVISVSGGVFNASASNINLRGKSPGGTLAVSGSGTVNVLNNSVGLATQNNESGALNVSGGTLNTKSIVLLTGAAMTGGTANVTVSGGVTNVGSGGISMSATNAAANTWAINLSSGTVGALNSAWSSPLAMTLNNSTGLASGNVTFRTSGTDAAAQNISLSGGLSGTGGLNVSGAGTLTLSGSNTYTGMTAVNSGVLSISSTAALPGWNTPGRYSVAAGAVLAVSNGVLDGNLTTILATGNFAAGASFGFDTSAANRTCSVNLGDSGTNAIGLVKFGANTLLLSGSNGYSGGTTITNGTVQLGSANALGAATGNLAINGGTLDLNGNSLTVGLLSGVSGGVITTSATGSITLTANSATSGTFGGAIQSSSGTLAFVKQGGGTLTLTGNSSYTGDTLVNSGTLVLGSAGAMQNSTFDTQTGSVGGLSFGSLTTGTFGGLKGGGALVLSNTASAGVALSVGNNNTNTTFTGTITGTASSVFNKIGSGVLNLTNSASVSTATTWVSSGTMNVNGTGVAVNATSLQVAGAAASNPTLNLLSGTATGNSLAIGKNNVGVLGVVNMSGGVLNAGPSENDIGYWNNCSGTFNLSGGTVNCSGWLLMSFFGTATINQTGGAFNYTNAGNVAVGYNATSGTGAISVSGGVFTASTAGISLAAAGGGGTLAVSGSGTVNVPNGSVGLAGLSGESGIVNVTGGTLNAKSIVLLTSGTITGASANVNVTGGVVNVGSGGISMSATNAAANTWGINLSSGTVGALNSAWSSSLAMTLKNPTGLAGGNVTFRTSGTNAAAQNISLSGGLSGTGGLNVSGAGTLTLSGSNTYTGMTAVNSGVLSISSTAALPGWATAARYSVAAGAGLAVGNGVTDDNVTTLLATGNFAAGASVGFDTSAANRSYSSNLGDLGANALGLVKTGTNTLVFSGSNSYSGGTTIMNGTLQVGSANALGASTGNLAINGGTLDLNGNNLTVGMLSGASGGTITTSTAGSVTLTVNSALSGTFAGAIQQSGSGALAFVKQGGGTLALTGNSSNFTGSTTVSSGTLSLATAMLYPNRGWLYSLTTINNGATVEVGGWGDGATAGIGQVAFGSTSIVVDGGTIRYVGGADGGNLDRSFSIGPSGATLEAAGGANVFTLNYGRGYGILTSTAGGTLTLTGSSNGVMNQTIPGTGGLLKSGSGTWTLSGTNSYTGDTLVNSGTLNLGSTTAMQNSTFDTQTGVVGTLSLGSLTSVTFGGLKGSNNLSLSNTASAAVALTVGGNNQSTTFSGVLSGPGSLTKSGTGTLILNGSNSYAGASTVSNGTLQIGDGVTDGSIASSSGITNNGALVFNLVGNQTCANISGTGSLTKSGASTLTLTGSNSYSGATSIASGTLQIGDGTTGSFPSTSGITVSSGATLALNLAGTGAFGNAITTLGAQGTAIVTVLGSGTTTFSNNIIGPGSLNQSGSGTTILTGNDTYAGPTNITNGVLQLNYQYAAYYSTLNPSANNALAFGTNAVTIGGLAGSGAFALTTTSGTGVTLSIGNNNVDTTFTGTITGTDTSVLNKIGSGTLNLTNSASVSTATTWVSSGNLNLAGTGVAVNATTLQVAGATGSNAMLNLQSGTATANYLIIGKNNIGALGVVNMSGGVLNVGSAGIDMGDWNNTSGVFNLSGGTVNCSGWLLMADWGTATINQTGGVFNYTSAANVAVGYNAQPGTGVLSVSGGVFTASTGGIYLRGQNPGGTLTVSGSGTVNVPNGTVGLAYQNNESGALNVTGGTLNAKSIVLLTGAGITGASANVTISGGVTNVGSGGISMTATNAAANTWAINLSSGTLGALSSAWSSSLAMTLNNPTGLDSGNVTFRTSGTNGAAQNITLSGALSGTGGLNITGAGILTLSGSNSYGGNTDLSAGTLNFGNAAALGASVLTFTGNSTLQAGVPGTFANNIVISPSVTGTFDTLSNSVTFGGIMSGSGTITKAGTGMLTLSSTNSYGNTALSAGTLNYANAAALGFGVLTFTGSSTLQAGVSGTFANNVVINPSVTGTFDTQSNSVAVSGTVSGSGAFSKAGTGTLTLSGNNTYNGGTTVSSGVLQVSSIADTGFSNLGVGATGGVSLASSGTLEILSGASTTARPFHFSNGTVQVDAGASLTLTAPNEFDNYTKTGPGLLVMANKSNNAGCSPTILGGELDFRAAPTGIAYDRIVDIAAGAVAKYFNNINQQWTGSGSVGLTINSGGTADLNGFNQSFTALGGTNGVITNTGTTNSVITVGTNNLSGSYGGVLSDGPTNTLSLIKSGSGTQTLSGSNTYSGGTILSAGGLRIGNANALGSGALRINGGTLDLFGSSVAVGALSGSAGALITNSGSTAGTLAVTISGGTSTYAGNIVGGTGDITLTKSGSGTIILSGSLIMAGLNANGGVTQLQQSGSIAAVSVSAGATLVLAAHNGSTETVLDTASLTMSGITASAAVAHPATNAVAGGLQCNGDSTLSAADGALGALSTPESVPEPTFVGLFTTGIGLLLNLRRRSGVTQVSSPKLAR